MRALPPLARISLVTLFAAACASSPGSGGSGGSGGSSSSTGGTTSTGGSTATGGVTGTGGTTSTGGVTGTGGTTATGGVIGTGGTTAAGGTAGTGTGGAAGHGGQTGTGGTTATGGAGGGSVAAGVIFSDDFEADTAGKQPTGWDNLINYNRNASNPMGNLSALADSTQTHNGSKLALHIKSDGTMAFLERALPSGTKHIFVRAYVYSMQQLGMGPQSDNHESLIGITADPTHTQLRFGQMKGAVGTSLASDDNLSPPMAKWNGPPIISAQTWHCIEVEFDGTATYNTLNAWSDSTLVHSITQGSDWDHGAEPANWMSGLFAYVQIGWESFSSLGNDVWMDDVVVATSRVGCN
ncbi:MAG TPA: hypothetical protein VMT03_22390 [Polyangia bacterium]|nr:hypothetical protein [Polyangia bacterium]